MSPLEMQRPFATVMLNGVQLLRCTLPTELGAKDTISATASQELRAMLGKTGTLECVMLSPNVIPQHNTEWSGSLILDAVYEMGTGSLQGRRQAVRTCHDWLANPPSTLALTISCQPIDPTLPIVSAAEKRLVQLVKNVLEDDEVNPRRGSLPSRLVGDRSREVDTELYEDVIGPIHPDWNSFITSHDNVFNVFQYGEQEIVNRGMEDIGMIGELRVVLRQKERSRLSDEEEEIEVRLTAFLKELLVDGDMTTDDILLRIASRDEFIQYVSPAFSVLMRALNKHRDCFTWTTDPGKPTVISLIGPDTPVHPRIERPKGKKGARDGRKGGAKEPYIAVAVPAGGSGSGGDSPGRGSAGGGEGSSEGSRGVSPDREEAALAPIAERGSAPAPVAHQRITPKVTLPKKKSVVYQVYDQSELHPEAAAFQPLDNSGYSASGYDAASYDAYHFAGPAASDWDTGRDSSLLASSCSYNDSIDTPQDTWGNGVVWWGYSEGDMSGSGVGFGEAGQGVYTEPQQGPSSAGPAIPSAQLAGAPIATQGSRKGARQAAGKGASSGGGRGGAVPSRGKGGKASRGGSASASGRGGKQVGRWGVAAAATTPSVTSAPVEPAVPAAAPAAAVVEASPVPPQPEVIPASTSWADLD